MANTEPNYNRSGGPVPDSVFVNKGESQNATQMISAALSQNASQMIYAALASVAVTLVALNMMPDLDFLYRSIVILYRIIVKKKWAVHTAFMGLYVFAAVLILWMTWPDKMLFGDILLPFWGKAGPALEPVALESFYPLATLTIAYWLGPRLQKYRERFLLMLTGAGFLWLGWCGFIGGVLS